MAGLTKEVSTMKVLKVIAEGLTTSFRYPHFMQQIHPSFQMPPPATIYGHICSALGEWFDPTGVRFAYHFTHQGHVEDIEYIIVLYPSSGYLKGTKISKVLEGNINPFERELLFKPKLTLYINRPEWESAFRSPKYVVSLGRSQDLFTYTQIEVIELRKSDKAYFEHTLLPYEMGIKIARGVSVLMPRFLDYANKRRPSFNQYIVLNERVFSDDFVDQSYTPYWVDITMPKIKENYLGLVFHDFLGDGKNDFSIS